MWMVVVHGAPSVSLRNPVANALRGAAKKKRAKPSLTSRSLNVLKKCEKGLPILIRQSFLWERYLLQ